MALNAISPGVYRRVIDLSTYVEAVPSTIGFICFFSEKGRDNLMEFATSEEALLKRTGNPHFTKYGQGLYNADQFIRNSNALYYVRCMPDAATFANLFLYIASGGDITAETLTGIDTVGEVHTRLYDNSTVQRLVGFYGIGRGTYYNKTAISLTPSASLIGLNAYVIDIYEEDATGDMTIQESFTVSFARDAKYNGRSIFIEDILATYSNVINCEVNEDSAPELESYVEDPGSYVGPYTFNSNSNWSQPFGSYLLLEGGDDAGLYTSNGNLDWAVATPLLVKAYLGLSPMDSQVTNIDLIYFTVVYDADYDSAVKEAIRSLCEDIRGDCVGILDNGLHTGPNALQAAITDRQTINAFNSWFVALYENHVKIYDAFTGRDIWVSPSYFMSAALPRNDRVADPWFAVAGFNRGALSGVKDLAFFPTKGDRDQLYLNQLNPIVRLRPGYAIWGQNTTYKKPSALRDLNIVRLLLYIDAALKNFALFYIFEQNDFFTWNDFQQKVVTFLEDIVARRGLHSYSVKVYATEYERQTNSFHADIWLQATPTVEKIFLNYYITK